MNNSRQPLISASETDVGGRTHKKTDTETLRKNPKVDSQLLLEFYRLIEGYERLIAPKRDFFPIKQGADYNLSHPFGSNDVPTDPREIGKRLSDVKRT